MSERKRRVLLASLGGVVATSVDVCVLAALAEHGWPIGLAAFLGSVSGALFCFVINKYLAFRDHRPLQLRQLTTFAAVSGATAVLMAGAMFVVCDLGHVPYLIGKALCALVVFLLWSYPAQRRLVFVASS
jgi:putative flippase GtrA